MQDKTIFQKIIDREIPATIVYEDDRFLAFLDINPVTKGHTLLIPKDLYVWIQDMPNDLLGDIMIKAKELVIAIKKATACHLVEIVIEGNDVPHFHIHLIPVHTGHKIASWQHTSYENSEAQTFAKKIKSCL